ALNILTFKYCGRQRVEGALCSQWASSDDRRERRLYSANLNRGAGLARIVSSGHDAVHRAAFSPCCGAFSRYAWWQFSQALVTCSATVTTLSTFFDCAALKAANPASRNP